MNVYRKSSPRCECLAKLTFPSEIMTADEKKCFTNMLSNSFLKQFFHRKSQSHFEYILFAPSALYMNEQIVQKV